MSKKVYQFIVKHPDSIVMVVADDQISATDKALEQVDGRCELSCAAVTDYDKFVYLFPKQRSKKPLKKT